MFCKQATQIADLPRQGKRQKQRRGASSQVPNLGAFGLFRFKDFESVASCGSDSTDSTMWRGFESRESGHGLTHVYERPNVKYDQKNRREPVGGREDTVKKSHE